MEDVINLIATGETPSKISDQIKDILYAKSAERINEIRPEIANSMFNSSTEGEVVYEKDEAIEAKFKKAKTPHLLSKFRQEHPGSRQPKMAPGAKETESDRQRRLTNRQVARVVKHGLTKKEKGESDARAKYDSPRD